MTDEEIKYLSRSECATLLHSDKGYNGLSFTEFWEEGYKKGLAEGKPKWHDLRKNPKDLPTKNGEYWCKLSNSLYLKCTYDCDLQFWFGPTQRKIIAWTKLPMFEEYE